MSDIRKKIVTVIEYIIGISLSICLFVGGLGFIGYMVAFCIGGDVAAEMCTWLSKVFYKALIVLATSTTLFSFVLLYVRGDAKFINPVKYWGNKLKSKKNKDIKEK